MGDGLGYMIGQDHWEDQTLTSVDGQNKISYKIGLKLNRVDHIVGDSLVVVDRWRSSGYE